MSTNLYERLRQGHLALILSAFAVVISLISLAWTVYRDPLRSRLSGYDFSTPKASLISLMELELNRDIGSQLALERLFNQRKLEEKLNTMEVHKEAEWRGNKILFVGHDEDGVKKFDTVAFTKDAQTGFWTRTFVSTFEVKKDDQSLSETMTLWKEKGRLE